MDSTLRCGHWLGIVSQFWLNLQAQYYLVLVVESVGAKIRSLPTASGVEYAKPDTGRSDYILVKSRRLGIPILVGM